MGIFLKAVDKFFTFLFKCVGETEFASCDPHASSSIPSSYCLASFIHPAFWQFGRVVLRPSVWSLHHARSNQHSTFAHGSMCVPPLTPSSQSLLHYMRTLACTLIDRTHFAFFQSLCTLIYYFFVWNQSLALLHCLFHPGRALRVEWGFADNQK